MEVFRISAEKYAGRLSASGSSNRWNRSQQFVIYTASSRSLASLELIAHRSYIVPTTPYKVMIIYIPDEEELFQEIRQQDLPANWRSVTAYPELQGKGSEWYSAQKSLALKVPSAIIPQESNYLLNTQHPDFKKKVKLINVEDFIWDQRLL